MAWDRVAWDRVTRVGVPVGQGGVYGVGVVGRGSDCKVRFGSTNYAPFLQGAAASGSAATRRSSRSTTLRATTPWRGWLVLASLMTLKLYPRRTQQ